MSLAKTAAEVIKQLTWQAAKPQTLRVLIHYLRKIPRPDANNEDERRTCARNG
eukprot:CAMPEP_0115434114 /NCGR_PEP_ID=MMETSP0271-20121206/32977_1 /TAXON_ID=71861 /ORGANISM="Scrippsiella trochoidea, Strain CCMP3099" /LENGTH=52 /DNA_ID=CAMNT_0002859531 /DNA_START=1252 /DNA_END=1408 /DNA_ORIENTATION=-